MRYVGIYIHIPFCVSKCRYCDFNSYTGKFDKQYDYIRTLVKEIKHYSSRFSDAIIDTIYIGGGTPSTLFDGAITTILAEINKVFNVKDDAEISIEANPNSITVSKAIEWRDAGINRVSVGLQTTRLSALKAIGRIHTKKDYINAIAILNEVGFSNINTDLMIGLPKQKSSDVKYAITLANKLNITHISCYSLILEEGTPLFNDVKKGVLKLPKEQKTIGMYITANNTLAKFGYNRYEVSNFAHPGYECKHNLNCWSMQEYIGFGAGAHSFYDNTRYNNILSIEEYIKAIDTKSVANKSLDIISKESLYEETIMLGLRKTSGIDISILDNLLNESFVSKYSNAITKYINLGYITIKDNILSVTDDGVFVLNQIILDFVV